MPRGRLLRTKVREAKALEKAKLETQMKVSNSPEAILSLVKEKISNSLENIDPLESMTVGITAYLMYTQLKAIRDRDKPKKIATAETAAQIAKSINEISGGKQANLVSNSPIMAALNTATISKDIPSVSWSNNAIPDDLNAALDWAKRNNISGYTAGQILYMYRERA